MSPRVGLELDGDGEEAGAGAFSVGRSGSSADFRRSILVRCGIPAADGVELPVGAGVLLCPPPGELVSACTRAAQHRRPLIVAQHVVPLGLRLGLLCGLLRRSWLRRGVSGFHCPSATQLPLRSRGVVTVNHPAGSPVGQSLVHGFRLQRHGLGICAVEAGIVEVAIDPQRDRHQARAAAGQKLNHGNGAWTALSSCLVSATAAGRLAGARCGRESVQ